MLLRSLEWKGELCGYEEAIASRGYQSVAEAENSKLRLDESDVWRIHDTAAIRYVALAHVKCFRR